MESRGLPVSNVRMLIVKCVGCETVMTVEVEPARSPHGSSLRITLGNVRRLSSKREAATVKAAKTA